jgi:hypothetical protein
MAVLASFQLANVAATFSPTDLSGLSLWLKANAGVTLNGSDVTDWADQSDQGNNFSVAGTSPLFESNVINDKPAIKFNGGRLTGNDIITGKTIYAVIKTLAYQPSQNAAILECTGGSLYSAILGNAWGSFFNDHTSSTDSLAVNTPSIIATLSDDGENYEFRKNGASILSNSDGGGFYSRSASYLGNNSSGGQPANIYISEIIVYNRLLTVLEIQQIEAYLNTKYAIY